LYFTHVGPNLLIVQIVNYIREMFPDYSNDSFTEQSNEVAPKRGNNK
jgi:hypothetical protein